MRQSFWFRGQPIRLLQVGPKSLNLLQGEEHSRVKALVNAAFSQDAIKEYLPPMQHIFESFLKSWSENLTTPFSSVEEATSMACAVFGTCLLGLDSSKETGQGLQALFNALAKGFQTVPLNLPFSAFRKAVKARESVIDKVCCSLMQASHLFNCTFGTGCTL